MCSIKTQVGGFDGANQLRSVERFNPRTGKWKKVDGDHL